MSKIINATELNAELANRQTGQEPKNPVTGKTYFGELAEDLLQIALTKGYTSHEWATLEKRNSIGETIAKNEKGLAYSMGGIIFVPIKINFYI